jgi:hypothetical protein
MLDLTRLTPIDDFEMTVDSDCHEDHGEGELFWACAPPHFTRADAENEAQFLERARVAFDGDPEALAWWEANRKKPPRQADDPLPLDTVALMLSVALAS